MKIPNYYDLFNAVLQALRDSGGRATNAEQAGIVRAYLAQEGRDLTGATQTLDNRIAWARTYLKNAGLIENVGKGRWALTETGWSTRDVNARDIVAESRRSRIPPLPKFILDAEERARARAREVVDVMLYVDAYSGLAEAPALTPDYLRRTFLPYLEALEAITRSVLQIRRQPSRSIVLHRLHRSDLTISLADPADVIRVVRESAVSWRRKHARELAALEEDNKRLEIAKQDTEILHIRASTAKTEAERNKILAEAAETWQRAESVWLQNEWTRLKIARAKANLVLEMIDRLAPGSAGTERVQLAAQLMPAVETLVTSQLVIGPLPSADRTLLADAITE